MQIITGLNLLLIITASINLNVINQKNIIIDKQSTKLEENQKQLKAYQHNIKYDKEVIVQKNQVIQNQIHKLNLLNTELKQAKDVNKHLKYIGRFLITYYDLSYESCNKYPNDPAYGHTYSGAIAKEGVTCAVDKNVIKLGSYIYIDEMGCRVAQDVGGAVKGNHIDVFVQKFSYDKYSTHYTDVYLIN